MRSALIAYGCKPAGLLQGASYGRCLRHSCSPRRAQPARPTRAPSHPCARVALLQATPDSAGGHVNAATSPNPTTLAPPTAPAPTAASAGPDAGPSESQRRTESARASRPLEAAHTADPQHGPPAPPPPSNTHAPRFRLRLARTDQDFAAVASIWAEVRPCLTLLCDVHIGNTGGAGRHRGAGEGRGSGRQGRGKQ